MDLTCFRVNIMECECVDLYYYIAGYSRHKENQNRDRLIALHTVTMFCGRKLQDLREGSGLRAWGSQRH
jgi:hypothetical protein